MEGRTISWRGMVGWAMVAAATVAGASCEGSSKPSEPPPVACKLAAVPLPPSGATGGDESFVVALRTLRMQQGADPEAPGFGLDLDRTCTCCVCGDDGPSCVAPAGQAEGDACDDPDGRDAASPRLFDILATALNKPDLGAFYSGFAEKGVWSILLRVREYNGQPNDDQVRLDWYVSGGFGAQPLWNGTDAWPVSSKSLQPGSADLEQPLAFDAQAYVSDGVLVAGLSDGALALAGGLTNLEIRLSTATLLARIEKGAGGGYSLVDGLVAARLKLSDTFAMVASFRDEEGKAFCTNDLLWSQIVKGGICRLPDIQVGAAEPNKPCDAISYAMGFDAHPAQLGAVVNTPQPFPGCTPETDPSTASCDAP